mmetsp:Transcript_3287/g.10404  ORF Transcript_3287/g.10404 Transcript_3287/m.10404 type:complete len:228 (+) Transcript_3287:97-780(+)
MKRARDSEDQNPRTGPVVVDVGGVLHKTTRSTLSGGSAYFEARLKFDGEEDILFVDRDGDLFHHVLSHLRGGLQRVVADGLCREARARLVKEAEYYVVPSLIEQLVVPPVGAAVRYYSIRCLNRYQSVASAHLGTVVAYDHPSRTWTLKLTAKYDMAVNCLNQRVSWEHVKSDRFKVSEEVKVQWIGDDEAMFADSLLMPREPKKTDVPDWSYQLSKGTWVGRKARD